MREEYLGTINERTSIMSETLQDLEDLHDDILASNNDEENLKEPMEE